MHYASCKYLLLLLFYLAAAAAVVVAAVDEMNFTVYYLFDTVLRQHQ